MTELDIMGKIDQLKSMLSPQEQAEVAPNFGAMGAIKLDESQGVTPREMLYNSLQQRGNKLEDHKRDILTRLNEGTPMSKSQTAAMMLIGALPMLVGGLVKGKKGITKGAEAGALGTQIMGKGLELENQRTEKRGLLELDATQDAIKSNQDLQGKSMLDGLKAQETSVEKEKDRTNSRTVAGIRASGEHAIAKEMKAQTAALRKDKLEQDVEEGKVDAEARQQRFDLSDGSTAVNKGKVKTDVVDAVRENDFKYKLVHDRLTQAVQKVNSTTAAGRIWGTKEAGEVQRLWAEAKNAWTDIKKIPGIKDSESYTALEEMMKDPTGSWNNIKSILAGKETIKEQLVGMAKQAESSRRRSLEAAGYDFVKIGEMYPTKNGGQVRVTGFNEDGSLKFEKVQ